MVNNSYLNHIFSRYVKKTADCRPYTVDFSYLCKNVNYAKHSNG